MNIKTIKTCSLEDVCQKFSLDKNDLKECLAFMLSDADWNLVSIVQVLEIAEENLGAEGLLNNLPAELRDLQVVMEH